MSDALFSNYFEDLLYFFLKNLTDTQPVVNIACQIFASDCTWRVATDAYGEATREAYTVTYFLTCTGVCLLKIAWVFELTSFLVNRPTHALRK